MTDIYLHIVARMADYMDTHPYLAGPGEPSAVAVGVERKEEVRAQRAREPPFLVYIQYCRCLDHAHTFTDSCSYSSARNIPYCFFSQDLRSKYTDIHNNRDLMNCAIKCMPWSPWHHKTLFCDHILPTGPCTINPTF